MQLLFKTCLLVTKVPIACHGFSPTRNNSALILSTTGGTAQVIRVEEGTPDGIAGSKFFGGNKQKEEVFYDIANAQATIISTVSKSEYRVNDMMP